MRIGEWSTGVKHFAAVYKRKDLDKLKSGIPSLCRIHYGLKVLNVGESAFFRYDEYSKTELQAIRSFAARATRLFNVQFHVMKNKDELEIARIA